MAAVLSLAVSFVLAGPVVVGEHLALFARQLDPGFTPNDIPSACVAPCQTLTQTITSGSCTTLSCLCTNSIASGLESCLSCAVKENIPDFNKTVADQTINGYIEACSEAGFPVSISGFSGTDSSTSGASEPPLSTATTTVAGASKAGSATSAAATSTSASAGNTM
ncbi:hypothetical protein HYPSUDRAFT_208651 [Hypholoma sublateritium FD-334 SS-4]|uniref:Uncharacterized protein n=1 Tax=Hypholoma sublateritium (strain FD-334 SS-4) TaxID=945553 RepID=A0A0D2KIQ0_HYPSF|nr:hypothetical protein HYPSUDRAFT_208651 [Hypholoma sublateritium FD-334 SS-4]